MDSNQSKVSVANAALAKCGVALISSFSDVNSKGAIRINSVYDQLRDFCLAQHPWTFAKKTTALATLSLTVPDFGDGVSIAYAYPSDWIKPVKWNFTYAIIRMEAAAIYSDTSGLMVKYTFKNDDPSTYSPDFIECLAQKIAAEICYDLTSNAAKAKELSDKFDEKLWKAISSDSQADTPEQAIQNEWLVARLAGAQTAPALPGDVTFLSPGPVA